MTIRTFDLSTGEETSRSLTSAEQSAATAATAKEAAELAAQPDPDADLEADIQAANTLADLKAALLGQGPNQAKVRGRK